MSLTISYLGKLTGGGNPGDNGGYDNDQPPPAPPKGERMIKGRGPVRTK